MAQKLPDEYWDAIRSHWENDPDEPSYLAASGRAVSAHGFVAPGKSTIDDRAKKQGWTRRGNLNGINAAAQRKADLLSFTGEKADETGKTPDSKRTQILGELASREDSENKRAEIIARHRNEWVPVRRVLQQSISLINDFDPKALAKKGLSADAVEKARQNAQGDAMGLSKTAKTMAEALALIQNGERKAWGLDVIIDPSMVKGLTDAELDAILSGKAVTPRD